MGKQVCGGGAAESGEHSLNLCPRDLCTIQNNKYLNRLSHLFHSESVAPAQPELQDAKSLSRARPTPRPAPTLERLSDVEQLILVPLMIKLRALPPPAVFGTLIFKMYMKDKTMR